MFWLRLSMFRVRSGLLIFQVSPSHFLGQPFSFFQSVVPFLGSKTFHFFWVSPSQFDSDLPFCLLNYYLISPSSFYSSQVWLEFFSLDTSTENTFFNEDTGSEEILTSYFYVGFTYTEILEIFNAFHVTNLVCLHQKEYLNLLICVEQL